ncbi:hypothetical protein AKJ38_03145 [candidate division MSBL1 archaeon SCGC-AAA259I14]|uniref:Core-binding (CB) domain-containing protein n=1 Tax=candidate division MSBL1 archaeon SCGC-AAA259I14 TaxID=1698268 RepID=A0A133UQJ0_9EURY|nr:hypothetical protein AKJ38_03145 [candidate division MSBL1 archaeon SCGC-AAA259I14]
MDNVGTPILMPVDLVGEAQDMGFDVAKSCKVDLQRRINIVKDNSPTFRMDHSSNSNLNWAQNSSSSYRNGKRTTIEKDPSELIADFEDFCEVDLDLADATVYKHKLNIRNFLEWNDSLEDLSKQEVRNYLKERKENEAKATYSNRIKTLRRFFRDFLDEPQLIEGFKLTTPSQNNCNIPDKKDLQEFYKHISNEKYRAIFLFFALPLFSGTLIFWLS